MENQWTTRNVLWHLLWYVVVPFIFGKLGSVAVGQFLANSPLADPIPLGLSLLWGLVGIALTFVALWGWVTFWQKKHSHMRAVALAALGWAGQKNPAAAKDNRETCHYYKTLEDWAGYSPDQR